MRNVETGYVISYIFFIEDSFQLILVMILKGYINELKRRLLEFPSTGALIIYWSLKIFRPFSKFDVPGEIQNILWWYHFWFCNDSNQTIFVEIKLLSHWLGMCFKIKISKNKFFVKIELRHFLIFSSINPSIVKISFGLPSQVHGFNYTHREFQIIAKLN